MRTATFSIANDDSDENPYEFVVQGTGVAAPSEFVFLANKITLEETKQNTPGGDMHSNGTLLIEKGEPSTYHSNLIAVGKITIEKRNTINGNVRSQTSISNSGTITGTKTIGPVNTEPLPSLSYSAGGPNKTVPSGGSLTLAPGSYGIVTMSNNGTLKLSSGEYFMTELRYSSSIEGGKIEIDLSSGDPVVINVVTNLQLGHEAAIVLLPNGESDSKLVTFNTLQSTNANWGREAYLVGSFNAPNAKVTLVKNTQLRGSISAKEILVSNDCLFLHHDSPGSLPGPGNLPKSPASEVATSEVVTDYALEQNYPNPFNPTTTISFSLPEASDVTLSIFNTNGQLVKRLVTGAMNAGRHGFTWDATDASGARVASGVYLYVIKAGEFTAQRRLLLLK
ncbi:T9SS C-terminal target domain-containing protein [candidate division KSB1 bacterium]|nr:T9SS C-terminal target domain-containing protein [candidate division KSB1 bacterium]